MSPGKASFDDVYNQPDPRAYFETLTSLEYHIPHHGQWAFQTLAENLRDGTDDITTVDLCCSYGINAALLNHDVIYKELCARYTSADLADLPSAELVGADREFFADRRYPQVARVIGLDAADRAIGYAVRAGLLADGFAENLEAGPASPELRAAIAPARLVTITGGVGYITERTICHVLDCLSPTTWVAAFVLRTIPYEPVAEALGRYGLITERFDGRTFPQRRFNDAAERDFAIGELARRGIDPAGREADGFYHTDFFLSRPAEAIAAQPIETLLG